MKEKKHTEFLRRIRLPEEEKPKISERPRETGYNQSRCMSVQERMELQKMLERRFEELFGSSEEDA